MFVFDAKNYRFLDPPFLMKNRTTDSFFGSSAILFSYRIRYFPLPPHKGGGFFGKETMLGYIFARIMPKHNYLILFVLNKEDNNA